MKMTVTATTLLLSMLNAPAVFAQDAVVRHLIPNSNFPSAQAIEIPPTATRVLINGSVPLVTDTAADPRTTAAYGLDTEAQTVNVLNSIRSKLEAVGLGLGDVVKMQVYLVAPDGSETMDFAGFTKGYTQFFGTETQPNMPTRSLFQIVGLANPGWLVEIEVEAVRF